MMVAFAVYQMKMFQCLINVVGYKTKIEMVISKKNTIITFDLVLLRLHDINTKIIPVTV